MFDTGTEHEMYIFVQHGATQTSELVNLTDFFNDQILPELKSLNGRYVWRRQLQFQLLITALWSVIRFTVLRCLKAFSLSLVDMSCGKS